MSKIVEKEMWDHYSELPNPAWYEYKNKQEMNKHEQEKANDLKRIAIALEKLTKLLMQVPKNCITIICSMFKLKPKEFKKLLSL